FYGYNVADFATIDVLPERAQRTTIGERAAHHKSANSFPVKERNERGQTTGRKVTRANKLAASLPFLSVSNKLVSSSPRNAQ
ncbi:hypothetical protein, partial [Enterococcus faecalis]|uniref:hypothetical protein n=1 Tax=Enterococcus faecalis TaxID=1351 RepID=UPI0022F0161E